MRMRHQIQNTLFLAPIQACHEDHLPGFFPRYLPFWNIPLPLLAPLVAHLKLIYIEKIVATLLLAAPRISGQLKSQVDALEASTDGSEFRSVSFNLRIKNIKEMSSFKRNKNLVSPSP